MDIADLLISENVLKTKRARKEEGTMSQPQRKRLRKSTKSCLECRKRKCKCTYDQRDGGPPCDGCIERQTLCVSQHDAFDPSQVSVPTRERVEKLESMVQSLGRDVASLKHSSRSSATSASHRANTTPSTTPLIHQEYFEEPSESGCDDDGTAECHGTHYPGSQPFQCFDQGSAGQGTNGFVETNWPCGPRERLLALVPSRDDALLITASAVDWWSIHNTLMPEPKINSRIALIEAHSKLDDEEHAADIARWLICLAITCLQLPSTFDYSALDSIAVPRELVNTIVEETHHFLSKDEEIGTLPGIECATMFAQLQKFIGRPKRGWLTLRRAISFAELMSLHSSRKTLKQLQAQPNPSDAQIEAHQYKAKLWDACCAVDRLLCLLLGVPSAARNYSCPPDVELNANNAETRYLVWHTSDIADRIVARDQLDNEDEAYLESQRIMDKLEELEKCWPAIWSSVDRWAAYDANTASSVLLQSGHSFLVMRCQLPYLLKARKDPTTHQFSASTCLQSCRSILRRYFAIRTRIATGAFLSRTFDIHAFTASIILVLHRDLYMPLTDAALFENAKTAMQSAPAGLGQALTKRMVVALNSVQQCLDGDSTAPEKVRLKVPVLGNVVIWRGGNKGVDMHGAWRPEFEIGDGLNFGEEGGGDHQGIAFDFDALDDDWFVSE